MKNVFNFSNSVIITKGTYLIKLNVKYVVTLQKSWDKLKPKKKTSVVL